MTSPGTASIKGAINITPRDEFQVKQGNGAKACLVAIKGILGKTGRRLTEEFGCIELPVIKTSPISGWCGYQTSHGFDIYIHVTIA